MNGQVYLIPTVLHDDEAALRALPPYLTEAVKQCRCFFTENEKTARRFLKKLWKDMVIDDYEWFTIHKNEEQVVKDFIQRLQAGHTVGILSEAGCPGIADPGQRLVDAAQRQGFGVRPLTGPSSILLALMGSGLNGQRFQFHGYLPIDSHERRRVLRELEAESARKQQTQIFIETPYRNNAMLADLVQSLRPQTRLCIACDLTAPAEFIVTKEIGQWKSQLPDIHKRPAIFLFSA